MTSSDAERNRAYWDSMAHEWVEAGERAWAQEWTRRWPCEEIWKARKAE